MVSPLNGRSSEKACRFDKDEYSFDDHIAPQDIEARPENVMTAFDIVL
jgi:hypothetical protein